MQVTTTALWLQSKLRVLTIAVLMAAILHIGATLVAPKIAGSTPVGLLATVAPLHTFAVLAPITPQNQPLAFMAPDLRYAMCRYDTSKGPVDVSVRLPGKGWALALYSPSGDNFYTALGQDGQSSDVTLKLTPVADRFLGLTSEARGKASETSAALSIPTGQGLIVVRGPDRGIAYRGEVEAALRRASCAIKPF